MCIRDRPETPWTKYLADKGELPVAGIYQFPGSGKEYPIKPGEFKIVAATAINHHTEDKPNSVDLSGACLLYTSRPAMVA